MHSETRNGTLYLSGDITVKTLNAQRAAQCLNALDDNIRSLDLSGVRQADSACLSLVLSCIRRQGRLKTVHLPASVQALAELYEIREWLDL